MNNLQLLGSPTTEPDPPVPPTPTPPPATPFEDPPTLPPGVPTVGAATFVTVMDTEGASTGTLTIQPDNVLPLSLGFAEADRFESDLGYESVQANASTSRRGYELTWGLLTLSTRDTLLAFLAANKVWTWTAPDEAARKFTVVSTRLPRQYTPVGYWSLSATVIEVR